jgi:DNA polymerase V
VKSGAWCALLSLTVLNSEAMYALVDCNNFYVSCERVFQPQFNGRPVIVLSNNDGCAVARSEEAKAIGIEMGVPVHEIAELIQKHSVKLFSSNYTLYGDMSNRVYDVLSQYSAHVENYSIDESFLYLGDMPYQDLTSHALHLRHKVKQWTGIPVSVGIAPTKTLAKLANRYAKKVHREVGVYALDNEDKTEMVLRWCAVGDVWGIGSQYAQKLQTIGVQTAQDFIQLPEEWVRTNMTVVGQRMYNELKGVCSIKLEELEPPKKGMCTSRSFGKLITDKEEIKRAVANFAARCAYKLRRQGSCTAMIQVFLQTNRFRRQDSQFSRQITMQIPSPTDSTNLLIVYALKGVDMLFQKGYNYHKAGVVILDITPRKQMQAAIWDVEDKARNKKLMKALDGVNNYMGDGTVKFAAQGYSQQWKLRSEHLSKCYTTRLEHVLTVKD